MNSQDKKTPAINQIDSIAKEVPGWTPTDQLYTLYTLAIATKELGGDILEIGSWCGRSAAVLGLAARHTSPSRVIAIDLFPSKNDWSKNPDGSYSFSVHIENAGTFEGYQQQTVWQEPYERDIAPIYSKYNSVLDVFNETMRRNNLEEIVTPIRGDARVIDGLQNRKVRLAFIDGDHSYESVCFDIDKVESVLQTGGWICLDDAHSYYEGVDRAINDRIIKSGRYDFYQQMTRKMFVARKK